MKSFGIALASTALLFAVPAAAQEAPREGRARAPQLQAVYDCRAITDAAQRLACFDRQVAALETAETARDVAVIDREEVRRTRRGLFGFSLGNLGSIFGGGDDNDNDERAVADRVEQIEAVISTVGRDRSGNMILVLDNDQRWVQTDASGGRSPRAGQNVVIRRASLGGFIASVEGRAGFRVRRER